MIREVYYKSTSNQKKIEKSKQNHETRTAHYFFSKQFPKEMPLLFLTRSLVKFAVEDLHVGQNKQSSVWYFSL